MGDIDNILNRDNLVEVLDKLNQDNPSDFVVAWYNSKTGSTHTRWYGSLPADIGLVKILNTDLEAAIHQEHDK